MSKKIKPSDFSDSGFWSVLGKNLKKIGKECVEKALLLYYAAQSPNCSAVDKAIIYGALAYLISPVDAIPDVMPVVGFSDDIAVIGLALAKVAGGIDSNVRQKAKDKLYDWFG